MERRRLQRRQPFTYLRVFPRGITDLSIGVVADLNTEGFLLVSETTPEHQGVVPLDIEIEDDGDCNRITVTVMKRWTRPAQNPSLFESGYQFVDLDFSTTRAIRGVIGALATAE